LRSDLAPLGVGTQESLRLNDCLNSLSRVPVDTLDQRTFVWPDRADERGMSAVTESGLSAQALLGS